MQSERGSGVSGRRVLVAEFMTPLPATIHATSSLQAALRVFAQRSFEHLPVIREQRVVGVVSDRDIYRAVMRRPSLLDLDVTRVMTPNPMTVTPDTSIVEAADILARHRIHCLPVVNHARMLVGMVTPSDVLRAVARGVMPGDVADVGAIPPHGSDGARCAAG